MTSPLEGEVAASLWTRRGGETCTRWGAPPTRRRGAAPLPLTGGGHNSLRLPVHAIWDECERRPKTKDSEKAGRPEPSVALAFCLFSHPHSHSHYSSITRTTPLRQRSSTSFFVSVSEWAS